MVDFKQKDFHFVTPYIYGRLDLVDFLKNVLGAEERFRGSGGDVFHAEFKIGDSIIMAGIGKTSPAEFAPPSQWGVKRDGTPPPATLYVYVKDVDEVYHRALKAGARSIGEPADVPWGDRMAGITDSYGNRWWLATFKGAK